MRVIVVAITAVFLAIANCSAQNAAYTVYFDSDKHYIPDTCAVGLIKMVLSMRADSVCIFGYCDSIGSNGYNDALSRRRAQAVRNMLVANGVPKTAIRIVMAKGEDSPIASNDRSETRRFNRRVEVLAYGDTNALPDPPVAKKIEAPKASAPVLPKANLSKANYEVGEVLQFPELRFYGGLHHLMPESIPIVNDIAKMLKSHPKLKVEIQGHVCCTYYEGQDGTDQETGLENLSIARANEIKRQLVKRGISANRMSTRGFGGSKKITEIEDTEEQQILNRRVEIMVVE
jgi:outer membrane protein OmpA-like peptidoglycan-associated protein